MYSRSPAPPIAPGEDGHSTVRSTLRSGPTNVVRCCCTSDTHIVSPAQPIGPKNWNSPGPLPLRPTTPSFFPEASYTRSCMSALIGTTIWPRGPTRTRVTVGKSSSRSSSARVNCGAVG